jgi:hypothetical protein
MPSCRSGGTGIGHYKGGAWLTARPNDGAGGFREKATGISLDQHLVKKLPKETPFSSVELAVVHDMFSPKIINRHSWTGPGQYLSPQKDPTAAAARIFAGVVPGSRADGQEARAALERLFARRKSVLDYVVGDVKALQGELGAFDRQRLDQHLESLRELERGLQVPGEVSAGCFKPGAATLDPNDDSDDNLRALGRAQMDNAVAAFACDRTRILTLMYGPCQPHFPFKKLGCPERWHTISHRRDVDSKELMTRIHEYFSQEFLYLLRRLDGIKEADGSSLLDNMLVLWGNENGAGGVHTLDNIPFVLAGSAGGYFKTGRLLKHNGASHSNLFVSILNALGVPDQTFGTPEHCTGPLSGLK